MARRSRRCRWRLFRIIRRRSPFLNCGFARVAAGIDLHSMQVIAEVVVRTIRAEAIPWMNGKRFAADRHRRIVMGSITRRQVLGGSLAAGCGLLLSGTADAANTSGYYRPIRYSIERGFYHMQLPIIKSALGVVAARFLDPRMFRNAKQHYRRWYMGNHLGFYNSAHFEAWFTRTQIAVLQQRGFPPIRVRPRYDSRRNSNGSYWAGRAAVGIVNTYWNTSSGWYVPLTSGTFDITLNSYLVGNSRVLSSFGANVNYWAGVIAHEMLHNLGHTHPNGVYDQVFIREYENALIYNGRYSRGRSRSCPSHVCCGC